ncbi:MAG TPA: phospholipid carrier-dependent glycosyltransferase [Proteobacteria bacterium]|nr:phospholipid carrier-dependent glycosyltransferase [Pseudomonadota bacterium]
MKSRSVCGLVGLWGLLVVVSIACRPPIPIDETRYLSVAWEMWRSGNFLVPQVNGLPYSHKPPLLFYLINLGWMLFGANAFTARLTAPLFALCNLGLTAALGRRLWPENPRVAEFAPFILLALPLWAVTSTVTMFDQLLTFFILLGLIGLLKISRWQWRSGLMLLAIAIGGGLLTKGPVVLLPLLPTALSFPWWRPAAAAKKKYWYPLLLAALLAGIGLALGWALPAARAGGPAYADAILWGQTAGRIVKSFAHQRPWWWYLPLLPLVLLPWTVLLVRGPEKGWRGLLAEPGLRFCLAWLLPAFILFSLVSGKQLHYLVPLLPALALLGARAADGAAPQTLRWCRISLGGLFLVSGLVLAGSGLLPLVNEFTGHRNPLWVLALIFSGLLACGLKPEKPATTITGISAAVVGWILLLQFIAAGSLAGTFDLGPMALKIAELQRQGHQVAIYPARFANQFHFPGRLRQPLITLDEIHEVGPWLAAHPKAYIVTFRRNLSPDNDSGPPELTLESGKRRISLWSATALQPLLPPPLTTE